MQNDGCCGIRLVRVYKGLILAALLCGVIQGSSAAAQEAARNSAAPVQAAPKNDDIDQLRKTVRQLGAEVSRLKAENARLEKYRQVDYLREQLLKEEQRVETLQKELTDIGARETSLQNRLGEIELQLRPDQIEQARAGVGSMRPEEDREAMKQRLTNEKRRIQNQLDQFQQNRVRIQSSINSAEASIVTLRQRLKDAVRAAGILNTGIN
jgi:peptidoglycan hydrolase CwlO-like protein